jgi:hypothetical protein
MTDTPCTPEDRAAIVAAADTIVRDALRYRWLRNNCASMWLNGQEWLWDQEDAPAVMDSLVDVDMKTTVCNPIGVCPDTQTPNDGR